MSKPTIAALITRIEIAENAMQDALERDFPLGSVVEFDIMHGQVNKSTGEVIGYTGGRYAYLRIRINSRARPVRDISARNCRTLRLGAG